MIIRRCLLALCFIQLAAALSGCGSSRPAAQQTTPPPASVDPTAAFTAPMSATVLDAVALDASASASGDGSALQYIWEFGGGQRGGGVKIAHVFAAAGDASVKLTVINGAGRSATLTKVVTIAASSVASTPVTAQILVKDVSGAPIEGAAVSPANASAASSDANGKMTVSVAAGSTTSLKFSKTGYADQVLSIAMPAGSGTDAYFEVTLGARDPASTLADASAGGTVAGRDGATIAVPANAFVDAAGAQVTGPVQIAVTPIDVTQPGAGGFPGAFEGVQADGSKTSIVSAGVMEFVPTANGAPIQLAPGKSATITIPVYAAQKLDGTLLTVGDAIPLWSLDEATGIWIQEGTGTIVVSADAPSGLAMQALVTHLSWWNIDMGFDPYGPQPSCEAQGGDAFASASICSMLAEIDRGLGDSGGPSGIADLRVHKQAKSSAAAAVLTPKVVAFSRQYAVPVSGGQSIAVPADVDVRLTAYALNGTWTGSAVVHGAKFVEEPVKVTLHPIGQVTGAAEAISLPFDDVRSVAAPATAQFTFTAPAHSVARVTLSAGLNSSFNGTLRLMQGTNVLATATVSVGKLEQVVAYLQNAGTYTIEADIDRAAAFRLQARLELSDAQVQPITVPFDGERSLLPAATATYSFNATAGEYLRVVVAPPTNGTDSGTPLAGTVRLLQGTTVLASATLNGASVQLLVSATATGPYTIEVTGTAGASFQLAADVEGTTQSETLSVPTDVTRSLAADTVYRGTFSVSATTTIFLNSRKVTGDLTDVKLLAADGAVLFHAAPQSNETDATNSVVATLQPGSYTVLVTPQNANAATERLTLATTSWAQLGPSLPTSNAMGQIADLVIDRNGKPVVGFVNSSNVNGHAVHTLLLRRWSGTGWETVGTDIVNDSPCGLTDGASVAFDSGNNPVVVYAKTAADNSTAFSVHRFSGGAWVAVGAADGQLPATATAPSVCFHATTTLIGADDKPVVTYVTDNGAVLVHFDGTSWAGYATPAGDVFGDGSTYFETRFDPSGKLWIVYSSGLSIHNGSAQRLNQTSHSWEAVGGTFPQVGTIGLLQPRLRFDSHGSPVVAWLAEVGDTAQGVALYSFDGSAWQTAGGHTADATSIAASVPDPGFVLSGDQPVLAWENQAQSELFQTVVAQTYTAGTWTPINGGIGEMPQYSHSGISFADAHNVHLASNGTDIFMAVIALPQSSFTGIQNARVTLLQKVGP